MLTLVAVMGGARHVSDMLNSEVLIAPSRGFWPPFRPTSAVLMDFEGLVDVLFCVFLRIFPVFVGAVVLLSYLRSKCLVHRVLAVAAGCCFVSSEVLPLSPFHDTLCLLIVGVFHVVL